MRIIGGIYRGKKLFSPLSDKIRPTADKARESVFNIIFSKSEKPWGQIRLADIFCGTGAFGLEAISRGAANVALAIDFARISGYFVESIIKCKSRRTRRTSCPRCCC